MFLGRVNWNATQPRLLAILLRWGERASGGKRNLVWKQPFQGVGDDPESQVKSSTLFRPLFPPFSCSSTPVPPLTLGLSRPPPLLRLHISHDSQAGFVRLGSYPFPGLWLVRFTNTARSWHASTSESVLSDRHGLIVCFNDQFPGYLNVGNWHRPGHGHRHRRAKPQCLLRLAVP